MLPPAIGYSQVFPADDRVWEVYERRKEVIKNMTDALFAYLTFDIDLALATKNDKPPEPIYSLKDLDYAQKQRESIQEQIDALEDQLETLPDAFDALAGVLRAVYLPSLQQQIKSIEDHITRIQSSLESVEGGEE